MEETIDIPEGVDISIKGRKIDVKAKGVELSRTFDNPMFSSIKFEKKGSQIVISMPNDRQKLKSMVYTIKSHVNNMITGVKGGFQYKMKILYTHFPISAAAKDGNVEIKNFIGEKGVRKARIIGDVKIKVDKEEITISGPDIENVSQTAANIEIACKLTRRDRRIFQDGIYIVNKG